MESSHFRPGRWRGDETIVYKWRACRHVNGKPACTKLKVPCRTCFQIFTFQPQLWEAAAVNLRLENPSDPAASQS